MLALLKSTGQVPNILSGIRLSLSWLPLVLVISGSRWWALVAFITIAMTDKLDGHLARKWGQISRVGEIIDPLADKLLVLLSLVGLCWTGLFPPLGWIVFAAIVSRELAVTILRYHKARGARELVIPANWDGKVKMALQSVGITVAFAPFVWTQAVALLLLVASLPYAIKSGYAYVKA